VLSLSISGRGLRTADRDQAISPGNDESGTFVRFWRARVPASAAGEGSDRPRGSAQSRHVATRARVSCAAARRPRRVPDLRCQPDPLLRNGCGHRRNPSSGVASRPVLRRRRAAWLVAHGLVSIRAGRRASRSRRCGARRRPGRRARAHAFRIGSRGGRRVASIPAGCRHARRTDLSGTSTSLIRIYRIE
jgi:hypothetical protein